MVTAQWSGTGGIEMHGTGAAYFLGDVAIDGAITWYTTGELHFRGTAGGPNAVFAMDVAKSGVFFEPGANDALPELTGNDDASHAFSASVPKAANMQRAICFRFIALLLSCMSAHNAHRIGCI